MFKTLFLLALVSCASGPKFQKTESFDKSKALVHLYRSSVMTGAIGGDHKIYIDDVQVASLGMGTYQTIEVSPGPHRIHKSVALGGTFGAEDFSVKSGEEYYFRTNPDIINLSRPYFADGSKIADDKCPYEGTMSVPAERMKKTLKDLDTRAQNRVCRPGFMFIKREVALGEISDLTRAE